MPLLPRKRQSVVNVKRILLFVLFLIFSTLNSQLSIRSAYAADPPNPRPCEQPVSPNPETLTHNWLVNENKEPPQGLHMQIARASGTRNQPVTASYEFDFTVDFSKMGALFGQSNSNYLEGKFQDQQHQNTSVTNLSKADFSKYNGVEQKAAPREMLDQLRVKYVQYIIEHHTLAEAGNKYTDINGHGDPKTIFDLVNAYQSPPQPINRDDPAWQNGWGLYWNKIPTAYSEFYQAYIQFRTQHKAYGDAATSDGNLIAQVLRGTLCPYWLNRTITFVMPEFFRTTATSGQLNQVIVPRAAQSNHANDLILQNKPQSQNTLSAGTGVLGKFIDTCLSVFKNNPVAEALKKVISFVKSHTIPQTAYAAPFFRQGMDPTEGGHLDCIRILVEDTKKGQDPYCALARDQLQNGETCTNQQDNFKLNKDNPNVICTFHIVWEQPMVLREGPLPNEFDHCIDLPENRRTCEVAVSLWPIFEIPWQTEIWNNTLYSDTRQNEPYLGSAQHQQATQVEGRPGVYSFFTPRAVFEDKLEANIRKCRQGNYETGSQACQDITTYVDQNLPQDQRDAFEQCVIGTAGGGGGFISNPRGTIACIAGIAQHIEKKKPGDPVQKTENDVSYRLNGGFDCSKEFVWHNALSPIALQEANGVTNKCPLLAAAIPGTQVPGSGNQPPGGGSTTLTYYILYGDTSFQPFEKGTLIEFANEIFPNNHTDRWDYVVEQSISHGISPAFAIAIWFEEGGFGGDLTDENGNIYHANSEFGCFPGGNLNQQLSFEESFQCFLGFTGTEHPYDSNNPQESFTNWVRNFCGPSAIPICSNNPNFIGNLESAYSFISDDNGILYNL